MREYVEDLIIKNIEKYEGYYVCDAVDHMVHSLIDEETSKKIYEENKEEIDRLVEDSAEFYIGEDDVEVKVKYYLGTIAQDKVVSYAEISLGEIIERRNIYKLLGNIL